MESTLKELILISVFQGDPLLGFSKQMSKYVIETHHHGVICITIACSIPLLHLLIVTGMTDISKFGFRSLEGPAWKVTWS